MLHIYYIKIVSLYETLNDTTDAMTLKNIFFLMLTIALQQFLNRDN